MASPTSDIQRIYVQWDEALSANDPERLLALYAPDAILESPLVTHLLGKEEGVCRGHAELKPFFEMVAKRKPSVRRYHRNPYFTDGRILMWEYPRAAPNGDQMDFVEVMEIERGLIQRHRVYWGWYGVNVLLKDRYHS